MGSCAVMAAVIDLFSRPCRRLVDEGRDDRSARHRCPRHGDMAAWQARCPAASDQARAGWSGLNGGRTVVDDRAGEIHPLSDGRAKSGGGQPLLAMVGHEDDRLGFRLRQGGHPDDLEIVRRIK